MAGEKEIACCVRGHIYRNIWAAAIWEVLVCSTEPTNVGNIFVVKFICIKYFHTFSVYEIIFTTKLKRITVLSPATVTEFQETLFGSIPWSH